MQTRKLRDSFLYLSDLSVIFTFEIVLHLLFWKLFKIISNNSLLYFAGANVVLLAKEYKNCKGMYFSTADIVQTMTILCFLSCCRTLMTYILRSKCKNCGAYSKSGLKKLSEQYNSSFSCFFLTFFARNYFKSFWLRRLFSTLYCYQCLNLSQN